MTDQPSLKNLTDVNYGKPPETQLQALQELTKPHIDSFNYMLNEGLTCAAKNIAPVEFSLPNKKRIGLFIMDATIARPTITKNQFSINTKMYPAECRQAGTTYKARLNVTWQWSIDNKLYPPDEKTVGQIPVLVKSEACNLNGLTPRQLIDKGEEAEEMGGYFVVNGKEKVTRMLIMPRRNYPIGINRPSWCKRGPNYTEHGVSVRCVADDQTSVNITMHYLKNQTATLGFSHQKEQFFIPVVMLLTCLLNVSDQFMYEELIKGKEDDKLYKYAVARMIRQTRENGLRNQQAALQYIGKRFRVKMGLPEWKTDEEIALYLFKYSICIHLKADQGKFNLLVYMLKKLFSLAQGKCAAESADSPMVQELLLTGDLYLMVLKEKLETWLYSIKTSLLRSASSKGTEFELGPVVLNWAINQGMDLSRPMEYLLATGNLISRSGLGLMQSNGLAVVADKLNFMRYLSHFRCVHRGAFFSEMRTTSVRKLLPEAWGFLCPVHTPDGTPCGLLNHLSSNCQVVNLVRSSIHLPKLLVSIGMIPLDGSTPGNYLKAYPVMLDGTVLGWISDRDSHNFIDQLRLLKIQQNNQVPNMLEIGFIPRTKVASQYPGIFLFTSRARMMRPVVNLKYNAVEMIGTLEQVYLNISINTEEVIPEVSTHQELSETGMLSAIASLTPFSDFNQSPRNMYQCQMGKQTMGTPCQALDKRADNKTYRLLTPQTPLVRPASYDHYSMDNYPIGTNAIVAVISYTGYDMEDAMILNKGSHERGFAHACIYKADYIDLKQKAPDPRGNILAFGKPPEELVEAGILDWDGLPPIGRRLEDKQPYYSYENLQTGRTFVQKFNSQEPAFVEQIKILGHENGLEDMQRVCIILRIVRNTVVGDKYSSRHGQKGICSRKWPVADMPFTESGMTPDILFNPHGYPSRMTIGMMIESMAGKSAATHGMVHDATPFTFSEEHTAGEYFSEMLQKAGYNYYGTERMYSGINGRELEADIFIGVVYYQRLRHMVSDKFQVRSTGPIDKATHQPVKGRKRGGGIRFGEMERDALIAHGTSFLLQDRLINCSDKSKCLACSACGSITEISRERLPSMSAAVTFESYKQWYCRKCNRSDTVSAITVPYIYQLLTAELESVNVDAKLGVVPIGSIRLPERTDSDTMDASET